MWIVVGVVTAAAALTLVLGAFVGHWFDKDSGGGGGGGGSGGISQGPVTRSKLKIGVCLATSSHEDKIPLGDIIDKIDMWWDWKGNWDETTWNKSDPTIGLYNGDFGTCIKKFLPMDWGGAQDDVYDYLASDAPKPLAVLSWNEPDMIGGLLAVTACPPGGCQASGCGIYSGAPTDDGNLPFFYGCGVSGGVGGGTDREDLYQQVTTDTNSTFAANAAWLAGFYDQVSSAAPDALKASPVMANDADILMGCAGWEAMSDDYKAACCITPPCNGAGYDSGNGITRAWSCMDCASNQAGGCDKGDDWCKDPGKCTCGNVKCSNEDLKQSCNGKPVMYKGTEDSPTECKSACRYGDDSSCRCNGWLPLLKYADASGMWDKIDIINIHAYGYYAHVIKLRILAYMSIFWDDISNGSKQIWLTEVACIYPDGGDVSTAANFLNDLLWNTTEMPDTDCNLTIDGWDFSTSLPGLGTTNTFTFNGKTKSWYDFGFTAITWFSASNFPGFDCGPCGSSPDGFSNRIESSFWTDGTGSLNDIWKALTKY